jgi:DNA-binding transcriptional MerR regulator
MKDLVDRTGLRRETIHFYISEGLLPPPIKKERNSAWYGDEHLERLQAVRTLQKRHFLPLRAIKAILNDEHEHTFTTEQRRLLEGLKVRFRARVEEVTEEPLEKVSAVAKRARVPRGELEEFARLGAITIQGTGKDAQVGPRDAVLIESWGRLKALGCTPERGFSPQDFDVLDNVVKILFDQELKLFTERFSDLDEDAAWAVVETAVPILNRIIAVLHENKLRQFISQFGEDEASVLKGIRRGRQGASK